MFDCPQCLVLILFSTVLINCLPVNISWNGNDTANTTKNPSFNPLEIVIFL